MAQLDLTFGMLFIGFTLSTWLYGIACLQVYNYFTTYTEDLMLLKLTVLAVILLDTAGQACSAQGVYWYLVTNYADPQALTIIDTSLCVESLITVLVTFIVQCFFAHSVYTISGRFKVLAASILFVSFAALVTGLAMSIEDMIQGYFTKLSASRFKILVGLDLGVAALSDIMITVSLCYYFHYQKGSFQHTNNMLDKLMVFMINRGVLTFILQALNLVLFVGLPQQLSWTPFHLMLSKVYTISFVATLNRRKNLRQQPPMMSDVDHSMEFRRGDVTTETVLSLRSMDEVNVSLSEYQSKTAKGIEDDTVASFSVDTK